MVLLATIAIKLHPKPQTMIKPSRMTSEHKAVSIGEGIKLLSKKIRHTESLHVFLWVLKDSCWMLDLKIAGTCMIVPTIGVAMFIAWITRHDWRILLPNLAVLFWISANV